MDDLLEAVELLAKLAIEGVHEHLQDVLLAKRRTTTTKHLLISEDWNLVQISVTKGLKIFPCM